MVKQTSLNKRCIKELIALGYRWMPPGENRASRSDHKNALLKHEVIHAIQSINGVSQVTALAVYRRLVSIRNNEDWITLLRGGLTFIDKEKNRRQLIRLVDFKKPPNNHFLITNELHIASPHPQTVDIALYINGIPVVVIETEQPGTLEPIHRLHSHYHDIPRLFFSNLFSISVSENIVRYGVPGEALEAWGIWRDPWPKSSNNFNDTLAQQLFSLLSHDRIVDILRHFIFFETNGSQKLKRICRYPQYRMANTLAPRLLEGSLDRVIVEQAQGSGRSIGMIFLALKMKMWPRDTQTELSTNNILVLTSRRKFQARFEQAFSSLKLPQPHRAHNRFSLLNYLNDETPGKIIIADSALFNDSLDIKKSGQKNWFIFIDELQVKSTSKSVENVIQTIPEARIVGFSSTWVDEKDNAEGSLNSFSRQNLIQVYGAKQAIEDGVTIPLHYLQRQQDWFVDGKVPEALFGKWFQREPRVVRDAIQQKGIQPIELAKCPRRIKIIAKDIWNHYQEYLMPNGLKAQLIVPDSESAVLYKRAIESEARTTLRKQGFPSRMAAARANISSACVYGSQESDRIPSENAYIETIRQDLLKLATDSHSEQKLFRRLCDRQDPLGILITSGTRFQDMDTPLINVVYLDAPLSSYNLLRAIGRTNRVYEHYKPYGLLIDYYGMTQRADRGLGAFANLPECKAIERTVPRRQKLKEAYENLLPWLKQFNRTGLNQAEIETAFNGALDQLDLESQWQPLVQAAKQFVSAYEALIPDPTVVPYSGDLKWLLCFLTYGEKKRNENEVINFLRDCSPRTYQLLARYVEIVDIEKLCPIPRERELKQLPSGLKAKASSS